MNHLDPDLKRLMKWAAAASPETPEEAPLGFTTRVLASTRAQPPTLMQELQRLAWAFTCVSLVLILCGSVLLVSQRSVPAPAHELPPALSFLASNLAP